MLKLIKDSDNLQKILINEFIKHDLMFYNKLAVACSGGIDSLAQTIITAKFAQEFNKSFLALIVDHSVRANSNLEAIALAKLLSQYNISSKILLFDNPTDTSSSRSHIQRLADSKKKFRVNQLYLRKIRYELLVASCSKSNINLLLTAHHQNDQVENIIIRQEKLAPPYSRLIPKLRFDETLAVFRPFLDVKKSQLKNFLIHNNIDWFEDSTNKDQKYTRNIIRKELQETKDSYRYNQTIISIKDIKNLKIATNQYKTNLADFAQKHILFDKYGNALIKFSAKEYRRLKLAIKSANQSIDKAQNSDLDKLQNEGIFELEALSEALTTVAGRDYRPKYKKIFLALKQLMLNRYVSSCSLAGCIIKSIDTNFFIYPEISLLSDLRLGDKKSDRFIFNQRFIITRHLGYHPLSLLNNYKLTLANNVLSRKKIKKSYGSDLTKITWQSLPALKDDNGNFLGLPIDGFDKNKIMQMYQISAELKSPWRFMRKTCL